MEKDFQKWHTQKEQINDLGPRVYFHKRDIWFCTLGVNVGVEQDGKNENFERPVLILKKFNEKMFFAIPLSSQNKKPAPYRFTFQFRGIENTVLLSQMRLLDSKRLRKRLGKLHEKTFNEIVRKLKELL